ncbi:hypothetical protein K461DRAFT_295669 [Myriangium duriaei CBS 260.36]|uniref:Uncharacterized protein n=1 Tax=Myriangium duriaei CBS 260.36 TaxID=1168546 RepID=A0A9P4IWZ6_9PEZI|nr:hypothetical protein K461DRAFT_295669 [Myriangium duriaei CBS 260.36]
MARNVIAAGLVAIVGLVEAAPAPQLAAFPQHAQADQVCSATYKSWLPLSSLPAATAYCNTAFPLITPQCSTTITATSTIATVTSTETSIQYDDTVKYVQTGNPIHTTTITITNSQITTNTTITFPYVQTVAVCLQNTNANPNFFPSGIHVTSTSTKPAAVKAMVTEAATPADKSQKQAAGVPQPQGKVAATTTSKPQSKATTTSAKSSSHTPTTAGRAQGKAATTPSKPTTVSSHTSSHTTTPNKAASTIPAKPTTSPAKPSSSPSKHSSSTTPAKPTSTPPKPASTQAKITTTTAHTTTTTPTFAALPSKTASSLSSQLTALSSLSKKSLAAASTICGCIRSNPACSTSTTSTTERVTATYWAVTTVTSSKSYTIPVPNSGTTTKTSLHNLNPVFNTFYTYNTKYITTCSGLSNVSALPTAAGTMPPQANPSAGGMLG